MILTLFSSKKKFDHSSVLWLRTRTSVGGVPSLRKKNNCSASHRHGLDQVVNHWRRDGHPLQLECLKQLTLICRCVHSASTSSLQLLPSVLIWVQVWGQGRPGKNLGVVVGEEMCGIVCCMGSGIVALKCSAIQLLMLEIQQQKKYGFLFLNSIQLPHVIWLKLSKKKKKKKNASFSSQYGVYLSGPSKLPL